jgi:phage internal scaffolding protein
MTHKMRFRTLYDDDYKADVFETEVGIDEGLVQQGMRDECDVNVIMARYMQTGELTHVSALAGEYGDYSNVTDYREGLDLIMAADELFSELPAKVRDRFKNDPAAFLDFANDPKNLEEMREMGLAPPKPPVPAPTPEASNQRAEPVAGPSAAKPEGTK